MLLDGKTAIVTGSSKGLGKAFIMLMAKEGAGVVVNGTVAEDIARVVDEINGAGGKAVGCTESVATMAGAGRIIQTALDEFGHLDILVNNAGILRDRTFLKMTEQEWDEVIAVHLKGTFNCTKFAAQVMSQQQSGRIINITSQAGFFGNVGQSNYAAAKAGIVGLSLSLAQEFARYNITVNVVQPRALTRMTQALVDRFIQRGQAGGAAEATALDVGLGEPEMVAPLVAFLASDEAKDVTGKIFGLRGETLSAWSTNREVATATMLGGWTLDEIRKRFALTVGKAV